MTPTVGLRVLYTMSGKDVEHAFRRRVIIATVHDRAYVEVPQPPVIQGNPMAEGDQFPMDIVKVHEPIVDPKAPTPTKAQKAAEAADDKKHPEQAKADKIAEKNQDDENEFEATHPAVNGQVLLDGHDSFWVQNVREGVGPGTFQVLGTAQPSHK